MFKECSGRLGAVRLPIKLKNLDISDGSGTIEKRQEVARQRLKIRVSAVQIRPWAPFFDPDHYSKKPAVLIETRPEREPLGSETARARTVRRPGVGSFGADVSLVAGDGVFYRLSDRR